ncbi:MAG: hypothetical protein KA466_02265, partial [Dialister sp.]|nr:hypothetical protein [Dialister sp.]
PTPCQEKYSAIRHPRSALGKKCLQHLLHKGSPGVQLIIAIREKNKSKRSSDKMTAHFASAFLLKE